MVHALLVIAFVVVLLRDGLGPAWWASRVGHGWAIGLTTGAMAMAWLAGQLAIMRHGRAMDRHGSAWAAARAERALAASRVAATAFHVVGVLGLGTLEAVRSVTGDLIAVDEVATTAPLLVFFLAGWWSIHPVERRLREAVLMRQLDEGRPVHALPSRWVYVWWAARHQMALVVVPVVLILSWGETAAAISERFHWPAGVVRSRDGAVDLRELAVPGAQLAGVLVVFAALPLLMRHVWDTVRLGPGPIRDELLALCSAHGVRVRDLLVWRTGGSMLNGAVMGLVGPARYILLTDALLESMSPEQVEAVTAHEVGHVRRHHMAWLGASALATVFVAAMLTEWASGLLPGGLGREDWVRGLGTVVSLAAGLAAFGYVSRRFEWQADAFAVQHLSGYRDAGGVTITAQSVEQMSGALRVVAELNHVPARKWSWRHGSIEQRLRKLGELAGRRADRLDVDRQARTMKVITVVMLAGVAAALAHEFRAW
jgi:STE24 endopeptidase